MRRLHAGRRRRIEPDDDAAVRPGPVGHVDVRHEHVLDVRRDQLVVERIAVRRDLDDCLSLGVGIGR